MPILSDLIGPLVFLAGLIVFLDSLFRIYDQFCKRTPWPVRVGVVFMGVGSLAFLHDPYMLGALVVVGRALQVLCGVQIRYPDRYPRRSS
jgi:hypothetical protein